MPASYTNIQRRLKAFDFKGLFTQELMWNNYPSREISIPIDDSIFTLAPVAEQRGMAVYVCTPPDGVSLPNYPTRRKIDTQVAKSSREHIVIFHDAAKTTQIWQWVKRESGKPSACREQIFYANQTGDTLIQKIQGIAFGLEEVGSLSIVDVTSRVGTVFDVEKVTKKFYELFKKEHDTFQKFVRGIPDEELQAWYVSVMLNRLMFIYFIQKKGFLNNDPNYLETKLTESKRRGKDKFYEDFLCPLFFDGFAKQVRSQKLALLLGNIPYLNGGLFLKHQIEELHGQTIQIPDSAFDRIFRFFEGYNWHLDDRPTRKGNEVNPDVLGYVFEKYINQKQMGAYYTKEDITEYISKNTIIPAIFDIARRASAVAFEGEQSIWRLLKTDFDRFIHAPLLHGVDKTLPDEIVVGASNFRQRDEWNKPAPREYALPNETWREVVARRNRCAELRRIMAAGEIKSVNDLVSYNLDIRRFAEEVISNCETPDSLRGFYHAIEEISVLDPACGSGAFLFAALNILERLYDTCLVRMQAFVDDLQRSASKHNPEKFRDFREILDEMNDKREHPSPRYFVLKTIILNNLYGVDIMEEATEICRLRLFLKLVSQVNPGERIEPLPDIDFNVRTGNTLVGFASDAELDHVLGHKLDFDNKKEDITERAEQAELAFERFREMQVSHDMGPEDFTVAKTELKKRLNVLRTELDQYLSGEYGIKPNDKKSFDSWRQSHNPFHWFVEFYGIMKMGGFDVVIGNPPYVEKRAIQNQYALLHFKTDSTNNLFAYFSERAFSLLAKSSRFGFIIPLSSMATDKFTPLQKIAAAQAETWMSNFDDRPARLFEGLEHIQLTILIAKSSTRAAETPLSHVTACTKWSAVERDSLFSKLVYVDLQRHYLESSFPKIGSRPEIEVLDKLWGQSRNLGTYVRDSARHIVYYTRKIHSFLNVLDFVPEIRTEKGKQRDPSEQKTLEFDKAEEAHATLCVLNSTLFRWFITVFSDCRNLNRREVLNFPIDLDKLVKSCGTQLSPLAERLSLSLREHSEIRTMRFNGELLRVQCIIPKHSKPIVDEIDRALASYYRFSEEATDFILNFQIKYRMGREAVEEEDAADALASN